MPQVQYADVNGVRLAYYEAGPRRGPPVVLMHGFPELAFSWRHQIKALAEAGRWVIAPDQRGYGLSDQPEDTAAYGIDALSGDLVGLLDHLGAEKAVWVGHDWGGLVGWTLPLLHPERTAGVVGLNTPFLPRTPIPTVEFLKRTFGPWHYIVFFQTPRAPEALFELDVKKSFQFFLRTPGDDAAGAGDKPPLERRFLALQDALQFFRPKAERQVLEPDELAVFVDTFERTGFRGGINWYRNMDANWARMEGVPQHVPHPALMISAELDVFLPPQLSEGMETYVPDLERALIEGAGHWTQQEKPHEVSEALISWLDRRFPLA
jgi:pimeloyl-ACP methyl ester carboxylesterase